MNQNDLNKLHHQAADMGIKWTQHTSMKIARACDGPRRGSQTASSIGTQRCGAPGRYVERKRADELLRMNENDRNHYIRNLQLYPEVFIPKGDPRRNDLIEGKCPCCGHPRPPVEDQGIVASRRII